MTIFYKLGPGDTLTHADSLRSSDNSWELVVTAAGDLVIRSTAAPPRGRTIWSGAPGDKLFLSTDGVLILMSGLGVPLMSCADCTGGSNGAVLYIAVLNSFGHALLCWGDNIIWDNGDCIFSTGLAVATFTNDLQRLQRSGERVLRVLAQIRPHARTDEIARNGISEGILSVAKARVEADEAKLR